MEIPHNLLPGDEALCDLHQCHCMFYGLRSTHWIFVKKKGGGNNNLINHYISKNKIPRYVFNQGAKRPVP